MSVLGWIRKVVAPGHPQPSQPNPSKHSCVWKDDHPLFRRCKGCGIHQAAYNEKDYSYVYDLVLEDEDYKEDGYLGECEWRDISREEYAIHLAEVLEIEDQERIKENEKYQQARRKLAKHGIFLHKR